MYIELPYSFICLDLYAFNHVLRNSLLCLYDTAIGSHSHTTSRQTEKHCSKHEAMGRTERTHGDNMFMFTGHSTNHHLNCHIRHVSVKYNPSVRSKPVLLQSFVVPTGKLKERKVEIKIPKLLYATTSLLLKESKIIGLSSLTLIPVCTFQIVLPLPALSFCRSPKNTYAS